MLTAPKYKRARRLGPAVYDKTQTEKFRIAESRRGKPKDPKHPRQRTDYGMQMLEKQKARFTYGINERQFSKYVREAMASKKATPAESLFTRLESRLDNAVYRLGFANSRQFARQLVSHGHFEVNGKRITVPSFELAQGDIISIRKRSAAKGPFQLLEEKLKNHMPPSWISYNSEKKEAKIQGIPKLEKDLLAFSLASIFEFYSR